MIITISAQKGGVAKTATAISISAYLARKGKRVLLIDLDGQENASNVVLKDSSKLSEKETVAIILKENAKLPIYESTSTPNLFVTPSHTRLSEADKVLAQLVARENRLKRKLDPIKKDFDFIIIDTPPTVNFIPFNAYVASDYVIVPFEADTFNLKGIQLVLQSMNKAKEYFNPDLDVLGFLSTKYDHRKNVSKQIFELLTKKFGAFGKDNGKVFQTKIPMNSPITYAHDNRQDVFGYAPTSAVASAYVSLIEKEILPFIDSKNDV